MFSKRNLPFLYFIAILASSSTSSSLSAGTLEKKRFFTPLPPPQLYVPPKQESQKPKLPKLNVTSGTENVTVSLSGHVNRAMTYADNGVKQRLLHVDNDNSSSRMRVYGRGKVNDDFTIGANFQFELQSNDSSITDIESDTGAVSFLQRETDALFMSKTLGTLSIGHGHTRSDTTSENDLSKTDVVALGCSTDAMTGGLSFRRKDLPGASGIGPIIGDAYTSMDGLGRRDRVRYDSPELFGFSIGGSHVMQNSYDVGLNHNGKVYDVEIQGSIAHAKKRKSYKQTNGSVSILLPCGLNFGGGAGFRDMQTKSQNHRNHPRFHHAKIGYIMKPFSIGDTAISIDRGIAKHIIQNHDMCFITGAYLVQNIDIAATEIYLGVKQHKFKRRDLKFHGIFAGVFGAKVRF